MCLSLFDLIPCADFELHQTWRRAAWLTELQAIAEEVSQRAALSDAEADALIYEAVRETCAVFDTNLLLAP
jgi:hypothetical protein